MKDGAQISKAATSKPIFLYFSFLIAISVVFLHSSHLRGQGLMLPINSWQWSMMLVVSVLGLLIAVNRKQLKLPYEMGWLVLLPLCLCVTGFIVGLQQPLDWALRMAAVLTITLLFLSFFQLENNRRTVEWLLYVLCWSGGLHALISVAQLQDFYWIRYWVAYDTSSPVGVFGQPNNQASLLATVLVVAFYLITVPGFRFKSGWVKFSLLFVVLLATYALAGSGSRVGMLGVIGGLAILVFSRLSLIKYTGRWGWFFLVGFVLSFSAGIATTDGFFKAYSKIERISDEGRDARIHIYRVATDLFLEKPLLGHGIGSFEKEFREAAAVYQAENGGQNLIGNVSYTHPHNELLYWAIEGGSVALAGFFFLAVAVVVRMQYLGWRKSGAYLALLAPIGLHLMVELPFYLSALHVFIFVFLLYLMFSSGHRVRVYHVSNLIRGCLAIFSIVSITFGGWFLISAGIYSNRIFHIVKSGQGTLADLYEVKKHPYFTQLSTIFILDRLSDEDGNDFSNTRAYIEWMKGYLKNHPDVNLYITLALKYKKVGDLDQAKKTLEYADYLYPQHEVIQYALQDIETLR